jgi:hypothetical protein
MTLFDGCIIRTSLTSLIEKHLGHNGRMISMSKSGYRERNPKSICYFNGCIFDESLKEIWYGDLDITKDKKALNKIAKLSKQIFYVTPEHPFRTDFNTVTQENLDNDEHVIKFNVPKKAKK